MNYNANDFVPFSFLELSHIKFLPQSLYNFLWVLNSSDVAIRLIAGQIQSLIFSGNWNSGI